MLPTIIFFSALMSVLYYLGVMQVLVGLFAKVMQKTLGTSGAETLSTAANIFVGQTEAPLAIRPYIASMTISELNVVMVGGFATIAGGVLAAYVEMLRGFEEIGVGAKDLLAASVISAPAALLIAKVMLPEVDEPKTLGKVKLEVDQESANVLDAVAAGTTSGLMLALNVGAMLLVFFGLIALANALLVWAAIGAFEWGLVGGQAPPQWTLEGLFGYLFAPLAWVMGIEWKDCLVAGELLGVKWFATEFVAYQQLGEMAQPGGVELAPRTVVILTYALCGFANFASIGIQLGGIGAIAPTRRGDLARLALRAMLGGSLAAFMTACIAGILL